MSRPSSAEYFAINLSEFVSNVPAMAIACGYEVTRYGVRATPCNTSFHQSYAGMPSRGIAGAALNICPTFSSNVNRETRSLTRSSKLNEVFLKGYSSCCEKEFIEIRKRLSNADSLIQFRIANCKVHFR